MIKTITLKFLDGVTIETAGDKEVRICFDTAKTKRDLWLNQIEFWNETGGQFKEHGYIRLENNDKLKLIKSK